MNNDWLAGFVAGEGCFVIYHKKRYKAGDSLDFSFQITVGVDDSLILEAVQSFLGMGRIYRRKSKNPKWQDAANYRVYRRADLLRLLPMLDRHLLPMPCKKAAQYLQWRDQLVEYAKDPWPVGKHRNGYAGVGRKPKLNGGRSKLVNGENPLSSACSLGK